MSNKKEESCECSGLHGSQRPCPVHGPWNINGKWHHTKTIKERDALLKTRK